MRKPAQFIVSLDCEGKWGMADDLRPCHDLITDEALARAYDRLIALFDRYDINATFAFVMAFALNAEERERFAPELRGARHDAWLKHYHDAVATKGLSGWHQPQAFELVRSAKRHEIACHGFCHRSLGDSDISRADANAELDAAIEVARLKCVSLETFVFPRNQTGHLDLLRSHGFIGYRQRLRRPYGRLGRALGVCEEFNIWATGQCPAVVDHGLVPIPSGRFLNWRVGMRSSIPPGITAARWRHQLRSAAANCGIVHLWLHPHNLITAPDTVYLLEQVLQSVAEMRDRGEIRVLTQRDYCREQLAAADVSEAA
jgi:peptidoglycan/xylan/chitin deacetylase (PgdA/CDA1 family)